MGKSQNGERALCADSKTDLLYVSFKDVFISRSKGDTLAALYAQHPEFFNAIHSLEVRQFIWRPEYHSYFSKQFQRPDSIIFKYFLALEEIHLVSQEGYT
jgi:hypothetical protein